MNTNQDEADWQLEGLCVGPNADMWTPFDKPMNTNNDNLHWRAARDVCKGGGGFKACPVISQCRAWSMALPDPVPYSMAGGRTPKERATLRRLLADAEARLEDAS